MWRLLHWLSDVSRPSSGISRLASSTSGVSHGSLKSAVVLKSNVCLRRTGAVAHPAATTASATRIINRGIAGLRPCYTGKRLADLGADPIWLPGSTKFGLIWIVDLPPVGNRRQVRRVTARVVPEESVSLSERNGEKAADNYVCTPLHTE